MTRTVFFVSDGTGITSETLGHSILTQFKGLVYKQITVPFVVDDELTHSTVAQINAAASADGAKPIVFSTLVNDSHRDILARCNGQVMDLFSSFVAPLEQELGMRSNHIVNQSHSIQDQNAYRIRMNAVHFALDNDDGARTRAYEDADIILIGVSRSGKTPTCVYMAMQFGLRAANYPLTEDDFDDLSLPKCLVPYKHKIFGLTINVERLASIRSERKPGSRYSSARQCDLEVRGIEAIYAKHNIPFIDATEFSIEEISTRILAKMGLQRRLQ